MRKNYLIVSSLPFAPRRAIQEYLTNDADIKYWYACLPNCVFCTTELSAHVLAKRLEAEFGVGKGRRFLVIEASSKNKQGRLTPEAWSMLNHPDKPKKPSEAKSG